MSKLTKRITALLLSGMLALGSASGSVYAAAADVDPGLTSEIAEEVFTEEPVETAEAPAESAQTSEAAEAVFPEEGTAENTEAPVNPAQISEEAPLEEAVTSYTVTLDSNGGYFENEWDDSIGDYVEQAEVVVKQIPVGGTVESFPVFADLDGKTMLFAGWSLEKNGELITTGNEEYAPVDNCVLYAVWQAEPASEGETNDQVIVDEETEQIDAVQEFEEVEDVSRDAVTAEEGNVEKDTASDSRIDSEAENKQDIVSDQEVVSADEDEENISEESSDAAVEEEETQPELNESTQEEEEIVREEAANGEVASGTCGDNLTWTLDEEGTLTISGTGEEYSFIYADASPWYTLRLKIKKGVISNGVTAVGNEAFDGCENLTSVVIANSVTTIGEGAFYKCTSLGEISIPNSVTEIEQNAFYGCSQLSNIEITDSVVKIGGFAFQGTPWLNAMGELAIFNHILLRYTGSSTSFTVPDGIKMIGAHAFNRSSGLQTVTIPDGVEEIWEFAFSGCNKLTEVELPEGVTCIEQWAFASCSSMTKIKLPNSVISIGGFAFYNCTNLSNVSIPKNVKKIDTYAFSNCTSFTDIAIPKGIQTLSWGIFDGCSNLASVKIPKSVTEIKNWALNDCSSLNDIYYEGSEEEWGKLTIGSLNNDPLSSATVHCNYSFGGNIELEPEISCVAGVEITVSATYKGSGTITSVNVKPDDESTMEIGEVSIGAPVGTGDDAETLISFPLKAKKEGEYNLTLTASDGTTASTVVKAVSIEYTLNNGILCITKWDKNIPVFTKPEDAPWHNDRGTIKQVIVYGEEVSKIDDYAFSDCPSLRSLVLEKAIPYIGNRAFSGDVVTIYQKSSLGESPASINEMSGVTGWIVWNYDTDYHLVLSGIGKMEDLTDESVQIAPWSSDYAYSENKAINEITITDRITRVGSRTFRSTPNVTTVNLSDTIKEMGSNLFNETVDFESDEQTPESCRINILFKGKAFSIPEDAFYRTKLLAYVPPHENTWNEDTMSDYGGKVSWGKIQWNYKESDFVVPDATSVREEKYIKGLKLIISGEGPIPDYNDVSEIPWITRMGEVSEIEISDSVTEIGNNAFLEMKYVSRLYVGSSVNKIGADAFCRTGDEGNYRGGLQIVFSGDAPQNTDESAFGIDSDSGDNRLYPIDIYYPEDKNGWSDFRNRNWTNSYLAWISGEPVHLIDREEVWGFSGNYYNGASQFGKKTDGYILSSEDQERLFRNLDETEKKALKKCGFQNRYNLDGKQLKYTYIESGGSCNGFSISEGLLYGDMISASFITKPLGAFEKNNPSDKTKSFINFYHLQQYLPSMKDYKSNWVSKDQTLQLAELEELVTQAQNNHEMVEISFQRKTLLSTGHSIMGYALEEGVFHVRAKGKDYVFDHRILTYDPSDYLNIFLTTDGNNSGDNYHTHAFYYSTNENSDTSGMWMIPYDYMEFPCSKTNKAYTFDSSNNARLVKVGSGYDYLNAIDYETGTVNFNYEPSTEILSTTEQNFDVSLKDGTRYEVRNGDIDDVDDGTVVLGSLGGDSASDEIFMVFNNDADEFTVQSNNGGWFSLYSSKDGILSTVSIESEGSITYGRQGSISTRSDQTGKVCIDITKDNITTTEGEKILPEHTVQIEINSAKEVTGQFVDEGFAITTDAESSTVVGVENLDTDEKRTVDCILDNNQYLITKAVDEEEEAAIKQDTDGDGVYETVVALTGESGQIIASGNLTNSAAWRLNESGVLTVFGKGAIPNSSSPEWQDYKDDIQKIVLRDGITSVGSDAFKDCKSCRSVSIPESVYSIGDRAFSGCIALEELDWIKASSFMHIGDEVFLDCDSLCSVVIPEGVYALGDYAFARCDQLKSVIIPDTVLFIGDYAFTENDSLENVQMGTKAWWKAVLVGIDGVGGGVTYPEGLFSNCPSLKTVTIPEGHRNVFTSEFENCESLQSITLPKTLERIKDNAFKNCGNLATVIYNGTREEWKALNIDNGNNALERCRVECSDGPLMLVTALSVTLPCSAFTYTGKAITPEVTLKDGSITLKKGTDYEVSYTNNTNIGTATVTITGIGSYEGTVTRTFTITPASLTDATVSGISNKTYTGSEITQNPTVKVGDKTLTKNTDYTVSYQNNTNVGTAKVTITGKSNYASKKTVTFKINKAAQSITAKAGASRVAVGKTTTASITGNKGKKSYKSSNTAIATVDSSTGKVTAKKVGTVKITATSAATANYNAVSKTITIKVVPAVTASLTAANQATGIKLTWKKVTGANGYKVYRGSTLIKTITSGSTVTFADTKANTNGTKYTYKVVAKATTGDSTLSKSRVIYRVSRPAISSVTNSASKKMTVKWGKNAKATGYQIQYSTDKNFKSGNKAVSITSASTVSKVIGSLTKGKTYYVRIRTYKTVGSTQYWSIWSAARSVKISK